MDRILNHLVGFRTRNKTHMIIAGVYYVLTFIMAMFMDGMQFFMLCFSWCTPFVVFAIIDFIKTKNGKNLIAIPVCFFIVAIATAATQDLPDLQTITINAETIEISDIYDKQPVTYTVSPDGAATYDIELMSDDPEIATFVGDDIMGKTEGTTQIYAVDGKTGIKSAPVTVTVVDPEKQEQRQATANEIMNEIDLIDENNLLENKTKIEQLYKKYNESDEKIKSLITNGDKIVDLNNRCAELEQQERQQQKTQSQESDSETIVYIGETGTKYHHQNCGTLKGNGRPISLEDAIEQGYTACKVCYR